MIYIPPVIIDNGSGELKAGFSGEVQPRVVLRSFVGRPIGRPRMRLPGGQRDVYFHYEEECVRGDNLAFKYPIQRGIVTDWEEMENIWDHVLYRGLRIGPTMHPIMLIQASLNPGHNRDRAAQVMFESFGAPAISFQTQPELSLFTSGRSTGLVVDCGDGVSQVVPIYQGKAVSASVYVHKIAGRDLTEYLLKMLVDRGYCFDTPRKLEIVRKIKEELCYVAHNFEEEMRIPNEVSMINFELPGSPKLTYGNERFRCPEPLFQPSILGADCIGIHESICRSIMECPEDIRDDLFANIILDGGSTMFRCLEDRLRREVAAIAPRSARINIVAPRDRTRSTWYGGSTASVLPSWSMRWISKEEYEEHGPFISNILHPYSRLL